MGDEDFFADCIEGGERYSVLEVVGKGSYGTVIAAVDKLTGQRVAIKKITNVFDHVSDATRILREIKLLRLLKHPGALRPTLPVQFEFIETFCIVFQKCSMSSLFERRLQSVLHRLGVVRLSYAPLPPPQILWRSSTSCCPRKPRATGTCSWCLN